MLRFSRKSTRTSCIKQWVMKRKWLIWIKTKYWFKKGSEFEREMFIIQSHRTSSCQTCWFKILHEQGQMLLVKKMFSSEGESMEKVTVGCSWKSDHKLLTAQREMIRNAHVHTFSKESAPPKKDIRKKYPKGGSQDC